jgi:hypothetical protein
LKFLSDRLFCGEISDRHANYLVNNLRQPLREALMMILMLALTSGKWLEFLISTLPRSLKQGILNTVRTMPPHH